MAELPVAYYYYDGKKAPQDSCPGYGLKQDWMKTIPIGTPICRISIPGTHDTMTFENPSLWHFQWLYIQCQNWTLQSQLDAGIRFIDIRSKVDDNELSLYHSTYKLEGKTLDQNVMNVLETFLLENPSEFIICRLKDETSIERNKIKDAWDRFVIKWKHLLWKSNGDLPLYNDELKGKVVVLRDKLPETSTSSSYSIQWADDKNQLSIVDAFFMQFKYYDAKLDEINTNIQNKANNDKIKLHFLSGTSVTHTPYVIAQEMNKRMCHSLRREDCEEVTSLGVIVMDYPGIGLIHDIIHQNKFKSSWDWLKKICDKDQLRYKPYNYMAGLPDDMPLPFLSMAGKIDPTADEICSFLHSGVRLFQVNNRTNFDIMVETVEKYLLEHKTESVIIWPDESIQDMNGCSIEQFDTKLHKCIEDIRGQKLLLRSNGVSNNISIYKINDESQQADGNSNLTALKKHLSQCATYKSCHTIAEAVNVITVTRCEDDFNKTINHFSGRQNKESHVTCGTIFINNQKDVDKVIGKNSRYPEMVDSIIKSNTVLQGIDIREGDVREGWNPYKTAMNHWVIEDILSEEYENYDLAEIIKTLHQKHVMDYPQKGKISIPLYNRETSIKGLIAIFSGVIQECISVHQKKGLHILTEVLNMYETLRPLAYFLRKWTASCVEASAMLVKNIQKPKQISTIKTKTKMSCKDADKALKQISEHQSETSNKLFSGLAKITGQRKGCIELTLEVSSERDRQHIRDMVKCGVFVKRYSAWLRERGINVEPGQDIELHLDIGEVSEVKQKIPAIPAQRKVTSLEEHLQQMCVDISREIGSGWILLGKQLNLSDNIIEQIRQADGGNYDHCLLLLIEWNENLEDLAKDKIKMLFEALHRCHHEYSVQKILLNIPQRVRDIAELQPITMDGYFLKSKCVRARKTPAFTGPDSILYAVVDQSERVGLQVTTPEELKERFFKFNKNVQRKSFGVESGDHILNPSEVENRNTLLQSLAEYLQRDICLYVEPDVASYKFSRTHTDAHSSTYSESVNKEKNEQEKSKRDLSNKSVLIQLVDGRYFQSLEPYLSSNELIRINKQNSELSIVDTTIKKMRQLANFDAQSDVIVVCLTGTYRSDKSSLLNKLIQEEGAFSTDDGMESHAHGVWICVVEQVDKYVVYLDTEGTHNPQASKLASVRLLTWCFSVCSEFMFYTSSVVTDGDIRQLFNLARLQQQRINSINRPFLKVLLRYFICRLRMQSATEYLKDLLTTGGELADEKLYLLQHFPHLKGYHLSANARNIFAEDVTILARDLENDRNIFIVDDSPQSVNDWMSHIKGLVTTINTTISTDDPDSIDLRQCHHNTKTYDETLKRFHTAITDSLSVDEIIEEEFDSWKYFIDNKLGHVDEYQQKWQNQLKKESRNYFLKRAKKCFYRMSTYLTKDGPEALQSCMDDSANLWNQDFNRAHYLGQTCMEVYRDYIDREKNRMLEEALAALPVIKEQAADKDATQVPDEADMNANGDDIEVGTQPDSAVEGEDAENRENPTPLRADKEDTAEDRAAKRQNLLNLFKHISEQNNFKNEEFDNLIKDFDEWRPFRQTTIKMLIDINTILATNTVNIGATATGVAVAGTVLLASLSLPVLNMATLPLFMGACALTGATSTVNMFSKLGSSIKIEQDMKKLIKEDDTHTCKFYVSLDKLVRKSQDRMQLELVGGLAPVDTIVRTMRLAGDAADIDIEVVPEVSAAAGLGSIGIAVDLAKKSEHQLSPILVKTIKQLESDFQLINAVCYYVALHKIQLLLR